MLGLLKTQVNLNQKQLLRHGEQNIGYRMIEATLDNILNAI